MHIGKCFNSSRDYRRLVRATEMYCAKCCDFSVCFEQFNECLNTYHIDRNNHQFSVPFNEILWHLSHPIL